jgi:DivIVA domain-containing protein
VALERQSIEKKDFPIGRRGYDPEAVDAHLAQIARDVEELKTSSRRRTETLASAASEQVRAIVEAAESSAAEIQRQAETEAQEIRAEAAEEAQATRQQASTQAREYVGRVSESTSGMLSRLDAMESELGALIESLRTGANRLNADLQLLESGMLEVRSSVEQRPQFEPETGGAGFGSTPDEDFTAAAGDAPQPSSQVEPALDDELGEDSYDDAANRAGDADAGAPEDETEAARLIALNMALNRSSREETQRYLSENFTLADPERLLDEVYASVEG